MSAKPAIAIASGKIVPLIQPNRPEPARMDTTGKTTPSATPNLPTHRFRYAGHSWRIYKRSHQVEASWYLEFERAGKRYKTSLETSSKAHAETEAKSYIDGFLQRRRDDRSGLSARAKAQTYSTLAEVFAVVPSLPITASQKSRSSYVWSTRWVLKLALDLADDAAVDAKSAEVLSKQTAAAFWAKAMSRAAAMPTQADRNTFLRTATTFYANAVTLLSPLPLEVMRETHNLRLPDVTAFRTGRKLYFREKVPAGSKFNRPADSVIRRTLVEWVRIARTPGYRIPNVTRHGPELSELDRRNVFIAAGLALSCGLRAGEFLQARWDWFTLDGGRPLLYSSTARAKNRTGEIRVRPVDPFWRVMNYWIDRNGWRTGEHCLAARENAPGQHPTLIYSTGGECDRSWWPRWLVGKWLRWLGWTTQKTNHALRDLSASYVTMKYGLHRAQLFCRHGQMSTTQQHYNQFVTEDAMDNPKALAWFKWAK